jgi:hypothetical protein
METTAAPAPFLAETRYGSVAPPGLASACPAAYQGSQSLALGYLPSPPLGLPFEFLIWPFASIISHSQA